jgi:hypothetical protein
MRRHRDRKYLQTALVGATAALCIAARLVPGGEAPRPMTPAVAALRGRGAARDDSAAAARAGAGRATPLAPEVATALDAFADAVRPLSHPQALTHAFRGYFAFRSAHPEAVTKPYLYFVDYGLPSTTPRGYVFDMDRLEVVDGPFMVAHGRGSAPTRDGVPTRFSNAPGSAATSLGLYVGQELYGFLGHMRGRTYRSVGLRLMGVSGGYNDNARARRVVAHGAPYVTAAGAGRSEGCPAVEPARAARLLPKLERGGMVFLFAPDSAWMAGDPWLADAEG